MSVDNKRFKGNMPHSFYVEKTTTVTEPDLAKTEEWLRDLEAKYAKPLRATPGEWIYHKAFKRDEAGCV